MQSNHFSSKNVVIPILIAASFFLIGASFSQAAPSIQKDAQARQIVKVGNGMTALGPQPEPPDKPGLKERDINPQPEPPGAPVSKMRTGGHIVAPGGDRAFQPQPEPPGKPSYKPRTIMRVSAPGSDVAFNPQPEPPAEGEEGINGISPQPEPPSAAIR